MYIYANGTCSLSWACLQPSQQQTRYRKSPYAPSDGEGTAFHYYWTASMTESVSSVQILLLKAQCYPFYFVDFDQEYELKDSVLVVKLIFPLIEIALLKSF